MSHNDFRENDGAVSEMIGEILVLAITVMVFGLLVIEVNAIMVRPHTDIVNVDAAINGSAVTLTHIGGDPVRYSDITVIINSTAVPYYIADSGDGQYWETGDSLVVTALPPAGQSVALMVYDGASKATLGEFNLR